MKKQPFFSSGRWYQPQYPLFDSLKFIVVLSIEFGYVTSSKQSCGTLKFPNLENAMIYPAKDLNKVLLDHSVWVLSRGRSGKLADFRGCDLDGANLEMANLPFAEMQSASLKGACLQGANFRKAQLTEVQLFGVQGRKFFVCQSERQQLCGSQANRDQFYGSRSAGCQFQKREAFICRYA
jgi:hypothetical protein